MACDHRDSAFHEKIAEVALKTYDSLLRRGQARDCEWTIMAAIVCEDTESGSLSCIAISTGVSG